MKIRNREHGGALLLFLIVLLFILGLFAYLLPHYMLKPIGDYLIVDHAPMNSSAIVVLLGAETPDRILEAHKLYRGGFAKQFAFGTGYTDKHLLEAAPQGFLWLPASIRYQMALESLGVKPEEIVQINTGEAFDTSGEMTAIANHARSMKWKRVIIVTSASHTRRSEMIWRRVAPDILSVVVSADKSMLFNWWSDPRAVRAVGYEYGALVKELFRQARAKF